MSHRGEPLGHLAGRADEMLDAGLHLLAPHTALPVPDLEDDTTATHASPPTTFHGDGRTRKSRRASTRNIGAAPIIRLRSAFTHHPVRMNTVRALPIIPFGR